MCFYILYSFKDYLILMTLSQTAAIEEEIAMMETEEKRLSSKKLSLYEDYRLSRITKEQYRKEYENAASRILEIVKRLILKHFTEIISTRLK